MSHKDETDPNPFQLDDSDDDETTETTEDDSETEDPKPPVLLSAESGLQSPSKSREDIPLGSPRNGADRVELPAAGKLGQQHQNISPHPLPPAPVDEEVPALFLPGLINPSLFLPIPNVCFNACRAAQPATYLSIRQSDQLAILLNKYIAPELRPARDLTGAWQGIDLHTLVVSGFASCP